MKTYIVWLELPTGPKRPHRVQAESLGKAIDIAMNEGRTQLGDPPYTEAVFAMEEGVIL